MSSADPRTVHVLELDSARWHAIVHSARDAIVFIDREGIVRLFNRAAEEVFHYSAAEVVGKPLDHILPSGEDEPALRLIEANVGRIVQARAQRKRGEPITVELAVSEATLDEHAGEPYYTAIIREVLEVERRYQQLVETSVCAIVALSMDGFVTEFNAEAEHIYGYPRQSAIGCDYVEKLVPVRERSGVRAALAGVLDGTDLRGYETPIRHRDGSERILFWNASRILDASRKPIGVIAVGQDVTERREAERRVLELSAERIRRERELELGTVAANIVHDLGNPLSGLQMEAELLQRRLRKQPVCAPLSEHAEAIQEGLKRIDQLVARFKGFVNADRLVLANVGVDDLMESVVSSWRAEAHARQIRLSYDGALDGCSLLADAGQLRRVLDNLVKNAFEAIDRGPGVVRLTAAVGRDDDIEFRVEDDGPGMKSGFDPFALFATTKRDGTGIGLAVARQIVDSHGGIIRVAPREPRGTVFTMRLPTAGPGGMEA